MLPRICTAQELWWINERSAVGDGVPWCKLIFSIKESVYKLFNPIHGVFLDFLEVTVSLDLDRKCFQAVVSENAHNINCEYHGRYMIGASHVYSSAFLPC